MQQKQISSDKKDQPDEEVRKRDTKAAQKLIAKKALDPFLKCSLCKGFLRNAYTINECLCSFCKGCIFKYFRDEPAKREKCPRCETHLGGKPLKACILDSSLQKIVDLVYPQFVEQDKAEVERMYRTFADNGEPIPKDASIVEYFGFTGEEKFFHLKGPKQRSAKKEKTVVNGQIPK